MKYLSVAAILRDEGPYLEEWVKFYLKQGVEHFYLYDNMSIDGPVIRLGHYEKYITWHQLHGAKQQRVAYNDVINSYKEETEWCAFLDIDEFLYSGEDSQFVTTLQEKYDDHDISGVAAHWLLFGSSGEESYRFEDVTKRFTKRAYSVNHHVKSIMRLKDTYAMGLDPHSFRATGPIVDENFQVLLTDYAIHSPATADILRINHYHTKSKQEYRERKKLPDANSGVYKDFEEMWAAHDVNEVEDKRIWNVI